MEIIVRRHQNSCEARVRNKQEEILAVGWGDNVNEAIGHMLRNYPKVFGITEIEFKDVSRSTQASQA